MRSFLIFFFLLQLSAVFSQVSIKRDSSNAIIISSTVPQNDGGTVTIESSPMDTAMATERLFNTTMETYGAIGRLEDEIRNLKKQATDLRLLSTALDSSNFFAKTKTLYAAQIYGLYSYKVNSTITQIEFRSNAQGNPVAKTGNLSGSIRLYGPTYIEIRNYFTMGSPPFTVDVFFCRKGKNWIGEVDGKKITIKPK